MRALPGPCPPRRPYGADAASGKASTRAGVLAGSEGKETCTQTCRLHFAHFSSRPDTRIFECIIPAVIPHVVPRAWEVKCHLGAVLHHARSPRLQLHVVTALRHGTLFEKIQVPRLSLPALGLTFFQSQQIFAVENQIGNTLGFVGQMVSRLLNYIVASLKADIDSA